MKGRFFNEGMISERGQSNRFRTAGFTLIELLVVVAVIAILASLLLPALSRAKQRAYTAVCINNLSQIGRGVALHAMDTGYFPPYMALRDSGEKYEWWSALLPYVGDTWPQTDLSPDGQDAVLNFHDPPQSRVISGVARVKSIYRCPAYEQLGGFYINSSDPARPGTDIFPIGSYAYNWSGTGYNVGSRGPGGDWKYGGGRAGVTLRRESEAVHPADLIVAGDAILDPTSLQKGWISAAELEDGPKALAGFPYLEQGLYNAATLLEMDVPITRPGTIIRHYDLVRRGMRIRHGGKSVVVLADGHVEVSNLKKLFYPTSSVWKRWNMDNVGHTPPAEFFNR